jgi:hypothetical protein
LIALFYSDCGDSCATERHAETKEFDLDLVHKSSAARIAPADS